MNSVTQLPNGVMCITKKSDEVPPNSMTYGWDSGYYDKNGNILKEYQKLPKFTEKLLEQGSIDA